MTIDDAKLSRSAQLLQSFWNINKNTMRIIQKTAIENGLTVPQYLVLVTVAQHVEVVQKKVGELTYLPKSTLSQSVDGLFSLELIIRNPVEGNRREMLLSITEKGIEFLKTIHLQDGGIHQHFTTVIDSLSEKQIDELLATHQQIINKLEENI